MSSGSVLIEPTKSHGALTAACPLRSCRGLVGSLPETRPRLFSVVELTSFHSSLWPPSPCRGAPGEPLPKPGADGVALGRREMTHFEHW
eukprot:6183462-Pleurochrysis_carterae.AAC.6